MIRSPGFTLIEAVVYLGLLGIIMGGVLVAVYQIIAASSQNQQRAILQEESNFLTAKLNWALTGASTIIHPSSTIPINNLYLKKFDNTEVFFNMDGANNLTMQLDSGVTHPLNNEAVKIEKLQFLLIPAGGGKPSAIQTTLRITDKLTGRHQDVATKKYLR